jgi:hypothetical protein
MTHAHCHFPLHSQEAEPSHLFLERNQHLGVNLMASSAIQVDIFRLSIPHIEAEANRILEESWHRS